MSDEADHTRRWLINASGAAILSSAIPAAPAYAQTARTAGAGRGCRRGRRASHLARHQRVRGLCGKGARSRAAGRGGGEEQAACARHFGRDGVRLAPQAGRFRRPLCGQHRRQAAGDGDRHRHRDFGRQCGARQCHGGPCRRDRRHQSDRAGSYGLRRGVGGAGHRRARGPLRPRPPARRHGRLRRRRPDGLRARRRARLAAAQPVVPDDHLRRRRGRGRDAASRPAAGAPHILLRGAAGVRHRLLDARPRACREGVRFRRHGGAQRRHGGHHGGDGVHGGRGSVQRRGEHLHGARRQAGAREAPGRARIELRGVRHHDQEMDRRLAAAVGARFASRRCSTIRACAPTTSSASGSICRAPASASSTTARSRISACSTWSR